MQINGKTKVYGIIGNPVEHTLSPLIHGTFADALGIDLVYVPFHVAEGQLEAALKGAYGLNIQGMNVTVPYKNAVIPFLTEVDARAEALGAVNTLVRDGRDDREGFIGYNTDISGLWRAMEEDGISLKNEEVIILGAGGVGRAVAFMCANGEAKKVYLLNRNREKADAVAAEVNSRLSRYGKDCVTAMALSDYRELLTGTENRYIVIQCTSVGLAPNIDDVVIDDGDFYHYVKYGYDLIYTPWETKFMQLGKGNGGMAYNGLKMLLYQGVEAFEVWNGCKVTKEIADKAYQKLCEKLKVV
ncbi:MAG: shikimate dehydrogenase [Lachnospiraceae bacterium]|nr:shikimate dehydrogenase [Lachnospiraceae bacterium]